MPIKNQNNSEDSSASDPARSRWLLWGGLGLGLLLVAGVVFFTRPTHPPTPVSSYTSRPSGTLTFHHDIAPVIQRRCTPCHQAGEAAPFPLETYQDVSKRAADIADVTARGYMPPWMPKAGFGEFLDERRLTPDELGQLQQWIREGAPEGTPPDHQPTAKKVASSNWKLGPPDLVVQMPEAYELAASGPDVQRNFVFPLPLSGNRFVRAVEFRPDTRAIHHGFILFDSTRQSRRQDARTPEVGFPGMTLAPGVSGAAGYFLSWQPGRRPVESWEGMAWPLKAGSDVVLQLHMQPTGKPERVQPSLGFYFTDQAPTNTPFKILLDSTAIDIPAGASNYIVTESYRLPVDVLVISLLPHAHFLARTIECWAQLPNGRTEWLLKIDDWDFDWQSDFRFARPVPLPRGSEIHLRFRYDNSENNPRNPNQPPIRVTFGPQSTDEMANLSIQMLPRNPTDWATLEQDYAQRIVTEILEYNALLLRNNPTNAHALTQTGTALLALGKLQEARVPLRQAVELDPEDEEAHYNLGLIALEESQAAQAEQSFRRVLEINPENGMARNNLGVVLLNTQRLFEAAEQFREALRHSPDDRLIRTNLTETLKKLNPGRKPPR